MLYIELIIIVVHRLSQLVNVALVGAPSHLRVLLVEIALTEGICLTLCQRNTVVLGVVISSRWLPCLCDDMLLKLH